MQADIHYMPKEDYYLKTKLVNSQTRKSLFNVGPVHCVSHLIAFTCKLSPAMQCPMHLFNNLQKKQLLLKAIGISAITVNVILAQSNKCNNLKYLK